MRQYLVANNFCQIPVFAGINRFESFISRNWQYKEVYRKIVRNQHHARILAAYYYLNVYNVHLMLASSTELKNSFPIDPGLSLYTKI